MAITVSLCNWLIMDRLKKSYLREREKIPGNILFVDRWVPQVVYPRKGLVAVAGL
jgi:hypothetical protein